MERAIVLCVSLLFVFVQAPDCEARGLKPIEAALVTAVVFGGAAYLVFSAINTEDIDGTKYHTEKEVLQYSAGIGILAGGMMYLRLAAFENRTGILHVSPEGHVRVNAPRLRYCRSRSRMSSNIVSVAF